MDEASMGADPLSDLLRTVRLTGATFFDVVAKAPWVAESPPRETILSRILPGAEHLIAYHVVTEGRCFAAIFGQEPIAIEAGEVIVFTKGDPHALSSSPGMRAGVPGPLDLAADRQLPFLLNYGGDGPISAKFVCGYLACDARPFNPLLETLPPVIKAGDKRGSESWLGQFLRFAMMEAADKRAGGESVLAKLSELMFIEVIRRHLEALPPEQAGWLAGLRDHSVGKALSLAARRPGAELDDRATGQGRRAVALGAGRALCQSRRHAADALSRQMADADRDRSAGRGQQHGNGRGAGRLRLRGGFQPRLQEAGRRAAIGVAAARPR